MQPQRNKSGPKPRPLAERFWRYVHKTDSCWLWTGTVSKAYGRIWDGHGHQQAAHRASWELHYGDIPAGLWVLHHCDTPLCIRPDHLWLGTSADNIADMDAKGRRAASTPPYHRGHAINTSRLVEAQVREIRRRFAGGGVSLAALGREYGVSGEAIGYIVKRLHWRWLPD